MPQSASSRLKTLKGDLRPAAPSRRSHWPGAFAGALAAMLVWMPLNDLGVISLLPLLRNAPWASVLFLVGGAGVGALGREKWLQGLAAASVVFWLIVAFTPLAARLVRPLPVQASAQEIARGADAVVVLSSSIQDDGEFTKSSLPRLMRGLELVRGGRAKTLVLTELRPPNGSYTAAAKKLTQNLKIPVPIVTIKGPVIDTHDEAVATAELARQRGWKRIFLVTSPTHTRRASLVFRHASRARKLVVLPVAAQEIVTDLQTLHDPDDRVRAFDLAIHEIIGLKVYRRRGWL